MTHTMLIAYRFTLRFARSPWQCQRLISHLLIAYRPLWGRRMTNTTSIAYQLIHHGTTRTSAWDPLVTQRTCTGNRQQDLRTGFPILWCALLLEEPRQALTTLSAVVYLQVGFRE
jgi:hypothetical protein